MLRALQTAASGMDAQQRNIDVTANNLANVNTVGFKSSRAEFEDLMYQEVRAAGTPEAAGAPKNLEVGLGVRAVATRKVFDQGSFEVTENPFDVAIEGEGFFQVLQNDGQLTYTRAGNFNVDANGRLVTSNGAEVFPPVQLPPDALAVSISEEGRIEVEVPNSTIPVDAGQLELARFNNPAGLRSLGRGLYQETAASGNPNTGFPRDPGFGGVSQGVLEGSNVEVVEEMVRMIVAQRSYELNSKVIRTADEMLRAATTIR